MIDSLLVSRLRLSTSLIAFVVTSIVAVDSVVAQSRSRGQAFIAVDATHQKILASENAETRLPVGDLTKVATAAVALDWLAVRGGSRSDLMTVPYSVGNLGQANRLGMQPGDQIAVRDALFAMLLISDNGAALTIADHFGRQMLAEVGGSDPVSVFVDQMNALSASEGMTKTQFFNPHGLEPVQGRLGLSTVKDMARLALYVTEIPEYNFIQAQSKRRVSYRRGMQAFAFNIENQNRLLGHKGVQSGKGGITPRAGQCLLTSVRLPDKLSEPRADGARRRVPYRMVTVTLNSPEKFAHTSFLIDQGWAAYDAWIAGGLIIRDPATEMLRDSSLAQR